jgi:hypothetical protein
MEGNIDKFTLFTEGATLIFKKWAAFRLTLDHNPEILDEYIDDEEDPEQEELEINVLLRALLEDIFAEYSNKGIEIKVSKMLYEFLCDNYDTYLEDKSEELVAKSLKRLFDELISGKNEYLNKLREQDKTFNYSVYSIKFPIEESTEDVEMAVEKLKIENEPDEDGFVEVKKGKKGF